MTTFCFGPSGQIQQRIHHCSYAKMIGVDKRVVGPVDTSSVVVSHQRCDLLVRLRPCHKPKLQITSTGLHAVHAIVIFWLKNTMSPGSDSTATPGMTVGLSP